MASLGNHHRPFSRKGFAGIVLKGIGRAKPRGFSANLREHHRIAFSDQPARQPLLRTRPPPVLVAADDDHNRSIEQRVDDRVGPADKLHHGGSLVDRRMSHGLSKRAMPDSWRQKDHASLDRVSQTPGLRQGASRAVGGRGQHRDRPSGSSTPTVLLPTQWEAPWLLHDPSI